MDARTEILAKVAADHGTPSFVYFMDEARARVEGLRAAYEGLFGVSYAMKCNPHPAILARMLQWVDTLDVSSGGELRTALGMGWPASKISFTGPAKQSTDLLLSVDSGIGEVVLESVREAQQLDRIARERGKVQPVLVRIAPKHVPKGFGVNMAGRPCQFGIDEEDIDAALSEIAALENLSLIGLHIYSGTQCLKPEAIAENYLNFVEIFRRVCTTHDLRPEKLIFGSGLGIPYHEGDRPIELSAVTERVLPALRQFKAESRFAESTLLLETGRYLIGEAGIYLTRVVNRKQSRGAQIATFDGGMNHHLGACGHLGMALHRNYRIFKLGADGAQAAEQAFDLYGPLCTTIDVLGRGVKLRGLEPGDVIGVHCSGAYGVTASPARFISHGYPSEFLVEEQNGELHIVDISERLPG